MKIYYESIKEEGLELETSFSFEEDGDRYDIKSFKGRIDKAGDAYMLTGKIDADFSCPCDRCLESMTLGFKENMSMSLSPLGEYPAPSLDEESGLSDEEAGMYVTPKDHFDLDDILREEVLLLPPIKRLCKEDCKGICDGCGANLNKEACRCAAHVDERLSPLAKLKKI